jgi:hypothetical protein
MNYIGKVEIWVDGAKRHTILHPDRFTPGPEELALDWAPPGRLIKIVDRAGKRSSSWSFRAGTLGGQRTVTRVKGTARNSRDPDPKIYLSKSEGRWRVIQNAIPISADKRTVREALQVAEHFKLKVSDQMWDGDLGKFVKMTERDCSCKAKPTKRGVKVEFKHTSRRDPDAKERAWTALQRAAERIGKAEHAAGRYKVQRRRGKVVRGYSITEAHQRVIEAMNALGRDKITPEQAMAILHEYDVFQARTRDPNYTKRHFDTETKLVDRTRTMSASQYRREGRKHVPAWIEDKLAKRKPGWVGHQAALRKKARGGEAPASARTTRGTQISTLHGSYYMPEKEITKDHETYIYVPMRGYMSQLAVIDRFNHVIGWIDTRTLGYETAKAWMLGTKWVDRGY